ncbi:uncharacterized protein LOC114384108 [Glycine soja]|uniref:uncharacterized protein LOC114384108 n=1 Tax=Glycine soja TaxID=3848 RepID=UPI00103DEF03|nr:uncharacterized protein LOC114384108 [Glycine soja]
MYDQLNDASQSTGQQLVGYITLLQCWIYEHFPNVHASVTDDGYDETSPRVCRWLTMKAYMKGLKASLYWTRIDALTIPDGELRWGPIVVTLRPERVVQQFGYVQTILPPPISVTLSYEDIDDRWMHYLDHLAAAGQVCLVLGQCSTDYMAWFFGISHPFITPTQAVDQPRHPPIPQHEAYVEPNIPEDAYEAIAKRLKRVLNLRMVTAGTELHNIMEDCLRIARGVTSDGNVYVRERRRWRTDHS